MTFHPAPHSVSQVSSLKADALRACPSQTESMYFNLESKTGTALSMCRGKIPKRPATVMFWFSVVPAHPPEASASSQPFVLSRRHLQNEIGFTQPSDRCSQEMTRSPRVAGVVYNWGLASIQMDAALRWLDDDTAVRSWLDCSERNLPELLKSGGGFAPRPDQSFRSGENHLM